jgi:hypothetical protein
MTFAEPGRSQDQVTVMLIAGTVRAINKEQSKWLPKNVQQLSEASIK